MEIVMHEISYAVELFIKNFENAREKRIVLYGKGPITEAILKISEGFNIVGIMDRDVTTGVLYDLKVISEKNINDFDVDMIVCVARPESEKHIFERISKMCMEKHILLYGLDGKNLFKLFANENSQFSYSMHFRKEFAQDMRKKIVLYGSGIIAKDIIENCPDYNIIGIMDKELKCGSLYGKPIWDYEEVLEHNVDIIVAATKDKNVPYVARRIWGFCAYNHIALYSYRGIDLIANTCMCSGTYDDNTHELTNLSEKYYRVNEHDLIEMIGTHDVITFDLFDTLVMRKTLNPTDVFYLVENELKLQGIHIPNFRAFRVLAQERGISYPNIYEIYNHFQELSGISDYVRDKAINAEIEIEKRILIPRTKMVNIMNHAIIKGKEVFIITDMYIPTSILSDILGELGITGYKKLYVSCDYKAQKTDNLFSIFKKEQGIIENDSGLCSKVLHVGDNEYSDFLCAQRNGLDSFLIKSAKQMLDLSTYAEIRSYLRTVNERSMVGLVISKLFNDPFALFMSDGMVHIKNVHELGFSLVAPLVTALILWLINELKDSNYAKMLFSARDGYLLNKLYRVFKKKYSTYKLPDSMYFMMSRRMIISASVVDEESLQYSFSYAPYFNIENNFHFRVKGNYSKIITEAPEEVRYKAWLDNKKEIFNGSKKNNDNFHKYLKNKGISSAKRYAFFDFVSIGSCQDFLERNGAIDFDAFYACFKNGHIESRKTLKHKEWLYINEREQNKYTNYHNADNFYVDYLFLESIMTSDKPSLSHFDDDGNPVYDNEPRSKEEIRFLKEMHKAIMNYFKEYIGSLWVENSEIRREVADTFYLFKDSKYSNIDEVARVNIRPYDDLVQMKVT